MGVEAGEKVGEAGDRAQGAKNLKQLGLELHKPQDTRGGFPAGLIASSPDMSDADATGFTHLLPFLEQDNLRRLYTFNKPWFDQVNFTAVGLQVKLFYCPSNRGDGSIDLPAIPPQCRANFPPRPAPYAY